MRERDIEKRLVREIRAMGGEAFKWVSPGNDGVPDRIVMLPGGIVVFVELKADRGRLAGVQRVQIRRIQRWGQEVVVVQGMDELEEFLARMRKEVMPHEVHTPRVSAEGDQDGRRPSERRAVPGYGLRLTKP